MPNDLIVAFETLKVMVKCPEGHTFWMEVDFKEVKVGGVVIPYCPKCRKGLGVHIFEMVLRKVG